MKVFAFVAFLSTLWQVSARPAEGLNPRDLVHDAYLVLKALHASSFCSSFAPKPTVVVTNTVESSVTATTSPTSTALILVSDTIYTTATLVSTVVVDVTTTVQTVQTDLTTITNAVTTTAVVTVPTTVTSNSVKAKRGIRGIPSGLASYAESVISAACSSYITAPTTTTTSTHVDSFTVTALQTVTAISTDATVPVTLISSDTTTTTATIPISTTAHVVITQTAINTITSRTTLVVPTATVSHTYSIATSGTGCGDIAYYNYLQDYVVTQEQCLDFCDADPLCQSVVLQCSQAEPCECTVNKRAYQPADIQCALPTLYYGPFTWWNKVS